MINSKQLGFITLGGLLCASMAMNLVFVGSNAELKSFSESEQLKTDSILAVKLLSDKKLDKNQKLLKVKDIEIRESEQKLTTLRKELENSYSYSATLKKAIDKKNHQLNTDDSQTAEINNPPLELYASIENQKNEISKLQSNIEYYESMLENATTVDPVNIKYSAYKACNNERIRLGSIRKSNSLDIYFNLDSNPLAITGKRTIYFVLSDSKGKIYRTSEAGENIPSMITSALSVNYGSRNTEISTSLNFEKKLKRDNYRLDIYVDGQLGGHASLDIR